jgi:hypothetical protein
MSPIRIEHVKFDCEKMGTVTLTKNTPVKSGAKFPSKTEFCSQAEKCGVGLPYSIEKCETIRKQHKA